MNAAAILDALMQGAGRLPTPAGEAGQGLETGDPQTRLQLLALASRATLLAGPAAPPEFDPPAAIADSRAPPYEAQRRDMVRLLAGKGASADDAAALAVALAFDRLRLRPHPFDAARLDPWIRRHGELLGPAAMAAAAGSAPAAEDFWFETAELDETNWMHATPARKAGFIAGLRARDPDAARGLVEGRLASEKAEIRVRLVDALATGLSADDLALLQSLLSDRAPSVRQSATRLLGRLPGTEAARARLDELLSRIRTGTGGIVRSRKTLALQLPANVKAPHATTQWLASAFGAIGSDALAAALGMDAQALADAARDDRTLLAGIAFSATAGRDFALLRRLVETGLDDFWTQFLFAAENVGLAPADMARWAEAAIPARPDPREFGPAHLAALLQALAGPLPPAPGERLLAAALGAPERSEELLVAAVALLAPVSLRAAAGELAALPPGEAGRARQLADLLISLHERNPTP